MPLIVQKMHSPALDNRAEMYIFVIVILVVTIMVFVDVVFWFVTW